MCENVKIQLKETLKQLLQSKEMLYNQWTGDNSNK